MPDMGIGHDFTGAIRAGEPLRHSERKMAGGQGTKRRCALDEHSAGRNILRHGINDGYLAGRIQMNINWNHAVKPGKPPLVS